MHAFIACVGPVYTSTLILYDIRTNNRAWEVFFVPKYVYETCENVLAVMSYHLDIFDISNIYFAPSCTKP